VHKSVQSDRLVCRFVCSLLNGTSTLFRLLIPRMVEMKQLTHVENDSKQTHIYTYIYVSVSNVYVSVTTNTKNLQTVKTIVTIIDGQV